MTEASHQMTSNPLPKNGPHKPGTVGTAQGSVQARHSAECNQHTQQVTCFEQLRCARSACSAAVPYWLGLRFAMMRRSEYDGMPLCGR